MDKSKQTMLTLVIAIIIVAMLAVIVVKYFLWIIFAGVAFLFGYYFGYQNGRNRGPRLPH